MQKSPMSLNVLKLFLDLWWWGIILLGVASIAWIALTSANDLELEIVGYASDIDTSGLAATDRGGQQLGVAFDGPAKVKLTMPSDLTLFHKVLGIAALALFLGACLYFVKQLRDIVRTIDQQDPFVKENARRVRMIGVLIIAFSLAKGVLQLAISGYADSAVVPTGFTLDGKLEFPFGLIVAGVAVVVLSEVFRHGHRLREEHSLTI